MNQKIPFILIDKYILYHIMNNPSNECLKKITKKEKTNDQHQAYNSKKSYPYLVKRIQ